MERCNNCGERDCDGVMSMAPDPYASEINDDYTDYWNCAGGRRQSSWEI